MLPIYFAKVCVNMFDVKSPLCVLCQAELPLILRAVLIIAIHFTLLMAD